MQIDLQPARDLQQLVTQTRKRLRRSMLLAGGAVLIAGSAGCLVVASLIDLIVPMSVPWRIAAACLFWLVTLTALAIYVLWPGVKPMRLEQIALRIERTIPRMHNRLLTVLDVLAGQREDLDASFVQRLIEQTRQRMEGYRVEQVLNRRPIKRNMVAASAAVGVLILMLAVFHNRMPTALARLLLPTADIPPVSTITLSVLPGDADVLSGNALTIRAEANGGSLDDMQLHLKVGSTSWVHYPMQVSGDNAWTFTIDQVNTDMQYRLVGGGTWTNVYQITMLRRPTIESLTYAIQMPQYMGITEQQPTDPEATQISAPIGSNVVVTANVTGGAARGLVHYLTPRIETTTKTATQEFVWFDDDVPQDAKLIGKWRWHEQHTYSGARAHGFAWGSNEYGMTTRLNPLTVKPNQSLVVYMRPDPRKPAGQATITCISDKQRKVFHWDSMRQPLDRDTQRKPAYIGQLGEPGEWTALLVPHKQLATKPKEPIKLTGITFRINDGKALFDRVAVRQTVEQQSQRTVYDDADQSPLVMSSDGDEQWTGRIPVAQDSHVTVRFVNKSGHASLAIQPMQILAIVDQPPSAIVEKPGQSITLDKPEALPIVVRAFDDFGVARVGIQTGPETEKLGETVWLNDYPSPKQNRTVLTSLDPQQHQLKPGDSMYYRLVVQDRKDQEGVSDIYRLGIAEQSAETEEDVAGQSSRLTGLLDGLDKLNETRADLAKVAGQLIDSGEDEAASEEDEEDTPEDETELAPLLGEDGNPLTVEELRDMYVDDLAEMTEGDRLIMVDQLSHTLDSHVAIIDELAQAFDEAALEAETSLTALPMEAEAIRAMAGQLRMMNQQLAFTPAAQYLTPEQQKQLLEKLAMAQQLSPQQQMESQDLRRQLEELMQAQEDLTDQPDQTQQQMSKLMTELQTSRASRDLDRLIAGLKTQQQQLDDLRQQVSELEQQAEEAQTKEALDELSEEQQKTDEEAKQAVDRTKAMLEQQLAPEAEEMTEEMPMPWETFAPDEAEKKQDDRPEDWWDQPVDAESEQEQAPDEAQTPREQLQDHQQQVQDALSQSKDAAGKAQERLEAVQERMQQLMQEMQTGEPQFDMDQLGEMQTGENAGDNPMENSQRSQAAMQQLQSMLDSQHMRLLQAVAARGMLMQADMQEQQQDMEQMQQQPPGPSMGPIGTSDMRPGQIMMSDLEGLDLTAGQSAALYRLPPQRRVPLVQGMKEKGPTGYQPLIDAYFRELTRQSAQTEKK